VTNKLAILFAVLIIGFVASDLYYRDGENILFLTRKLNELIEYLAFWR
jgi:hypothetical protein